MATDGATGAKGPVTEHKHSESSGSDSGSEAVLSGFAIDREYNNGSILIEPYDMANLSNAGYAISLGRHFYRGSTTAGYLRPGAGVKDYWGLPIAATEIKTDTPVAERFGVEVDNAVITLAPGETILGHSMEFLGCDHTYVPVLVERQATIQAGIRVSGYSTVEDNGVFGRWTLLITNHSRWTVVLTMNEYIASIRWITTAIPEDCKLRFRPDCDRVISTWDPLMLVRSPYTERSQRICHHIMSSLAATGAISEALGPWATDRGTVDHTGIDKIFDEARSTERKAGKDHRPRAGAAAPPAGLSLSGSGSPPAGKP